MNFYHFIIDNKESGKTKLAIELFLESAWDTLFLVKSQKERKEVIKRIEKKVSEECLFIKDGWTRQIKIINSDAGRGYRVNKVIIDDFFYFPNYKDITYSLIPCLGFEGQICFFSELNDIKENMDFMKNIEATIYNINTFKKSFSKMCEQEKSLLKLEEYLNKIYQC